MTIVTRAPADRDGDHVARLGDDEFAILVHGHAAVASTPAARLLSRPESPFVAGGREILVQASVGVVDNDLARSLQPEDLLRDADLATCLAKSSGKNRVVTYTAGVDRIVRERAELASDLHQALSGGQFAVHYQPVIAGTDGRLVGVEALLRWNHPTRGLVPPMEFIPLAEETGEIREIGAWVLRTAAAQVAAWQRTIEGCEQLELAVNLSPVQLRDGDLGEAVLATLLATSLPAEWLTLEVTETMLLLDLDRARRHLDVLRTAGVRVAIDDFGTGYSSFSYLSTLPADVIKIDQSFVKDLEVGTGPFVLVQAVIDMARGLRLDIVAEGVEESGQQAMLNELGCPHSQGYLFSPALPPVEFARFVAAWPARSAEIVEGYTVPSEIAS